MAKFRSKNEQSTSTTVLQTSTEEEVAPFFIDLSKLNDSQLSNLRGVGLVTEAGYDVRLLREKHTKYLLGGLDKLSSGYVSLDSSRPWIAYWVLHSLDLLNTVPLEMCPRIISTLSHFQVATGGFGGGPSQVRKTTSTSCKHTKHKHPPTPTHILFNRRPFCSHLALLTPCPRPAPPLRTHLRLLPRSPSHRAPPPRGLRCHQPPRAVPLVSAHEGAQRRVPHARRRRGGRARHLHSRRHC